MSAGASNAFWGAALAPFVLLVLMTFFVRPITRKVFGWLPPGRIRDFLFRERTRPTATRRDRATMAAAVILFYVALGAMTAFLMR